MGDLLIRNLRCVTCVVLSAVTFGCGNAITAPKPLPPPFITMSNSGFVHEYYRGVTLDEFTGSSQGRSLDSIDFDMTIPKYCIVLVTGKVASHDVPLEITTTFTNGYLQTIAKTWKVAPDKQEATVRGLFFVPEDYLSAMTAISSSGTNVENDQPRTAAGT